MRDEKAREAAEKKAKRETERAAARQELAREKAARAVEREAKRAQNAREAELRKAEAEKKRIESVQIKKKRALKLPKLVKKGQLTIVGLMGLESALARYGRKFADRIQ